jgi:hypothetical protein
MGYLIAGCSAKAQRLQSKKVERPSIDAIYNDILLSQYPALNPLHVRLLVDIAIYRQSLSYFISYGTV